MPENVDETGSAVRRAFFDVVDLPAEEQPAAVARACAGDRALEAEVRALLKADREASGFLGQPTALPGEGVGTPWFASGVDVGPSIGTRIGRYRLLELIGEGGFGSVYLAEQETPVFRKVALKVIKLGMDTRQVVARFEHERQALAMMDHPNIARVLDAGATETGRPYFVMDLVKGAPIVAYCDEQQLSIDERLDLLAQVCGAVQHAHTKGIIHRDIKPSNVLVSTLDGRPSIKVIDFGIAKAMDARLTERTLFTEHRALIGTPEYMSPEQAEGSLDIDTRSDVYSLGVLLYELLTGSTPLSSKELRSSTQAEVRRIIRDVEPATPSTRISQNSKLNSKGIAEIAARRRTDPRTLGTMVRGELDWIVMRALEKDRIRRYETAESLAIDLRRYRAGEPIAAAPPSRRYRLQKFIGRNRGPVAAGAAVGAALLVGMVAFAWQARVAGMQRDRALDAEAETAARAAELKRVSEFQAAMLSQIDPTQAGRKLAESVAALHAEELAREGLPESEQQARAAAFAAEWQRVNAIDAAKGLIDQVILSPAVAALDKQFGDQPVLDASLRQALSDRYSELGLYAAATPLQEAALAARTRLLGEDHPDTLASLDRAARLLILRGKLADADPMSLRSLERSRRVLGDRHPQTLKALNNRAVLLLRQFKPAEAEPLLREVLESHVRAGGEDSPDALATKNNLGAALKAQGKLADAEGWYLQAMEGRRRVLGPSHPMTLQSVRNVAGLLFAQGQMQRAEPLYREALEGYRRSIGDDHPDTINAMNSMASVLEQLGRLTEAEAMYREAAARSGRVLGPEHGVTLNALNNLASCLMLQRRAPEAEACCRPVVETRVRVLGSDHPESLSTMITLARALLMQSKAAEATALLAPAEKAVVGLTPTQYVDLRAEYRLCLGVSMSGVGRFAAGEEQLQESLRQASATPNVRAGLQREILEALADLSDAWDRAEPGQGHAEAGAAWRARLNAAARPSIAAPSTK